MTRLVEKDKGGGDKNRNIDFEIGKRREGCRIGRLIEFSTLIIHREPTLPTNRIDLTRISYRIGRVKYRRGIQFTNKSPPLSRFHENFFSFQAGLQVDS